MSDEREAIRYDEDEAVRSTADDQDVEAHQLRDQIREAVRSEGDDDVEAHQLRDQLRD